MRRVFVLLVLLTGCGGAEFTPDLFLAVADAGPPVEAAPDAPANAPDAALDAPVDSPRMDDAPDGAGDEGDATTDAPACGTVGMPCCINFVCDEPLTCAQGTCH